MLLPLIITMSIVALTFLVFRREKWALVRIPVKTPKSKRINRIPQR